MHGGEANLHQNVSLLVTPLDQKKKGIHLGDFTFVKSKHIFLNVSLYENKMVVQESERVQRWVRKRDSQATLVNFTAIIQNIILKGYSDLLKASQTSY